MVTAVLDAEPHKDRFQFRIGSVLLVHHSLTRRSIVNQTRFLLVLCLLLASIPLVAVDSPRATAPPKGYVCHKIAKPPTIDGKLDDAAWKDTAWTDDFVDIEGDAKPKPRFRTRVKMAWDDAALYIAAELEEPHVWATLDKHDAVIFNDPDFEVFLDPDGDNHLYGELELNAKNTTWDLLLSKPYKDAGRALNGWEIIGLKTAVHVQGTINDSRDTDRGWRVEIAWPWEGLKELSTSAAPPKDGDRWRINFSRVEWDIAIEDGRYAKVPKKPEHNWVWSPQGVIDMHRPERWGYLQFSAKAPGTVKYENDPTQAVKDRLHELYYAQLAHLKKHGAFAKTLADLGHKTEQSVKLESTDRGYEIWIPSGGKRIGISHDSLLWVK